MVAKRAQESESNGPKCSLGKVSGKSGRETPRLFGAAKQAAPAPATPAPTREPEEEEDEREEEEEDEARDSVPEMPPMAPAPAAATPSSQMTSGLATPVPASPSPRKGAAATGTPTPIGKRPGAADEEVCSKCGLPVPSNESGSLSSNGRSKQSVHIACASAYKRRMRQNSKNRALKLAWEKQTAEEQIEWFKRNASAEVREGVGKDTAEHTVEQVEETASDFNVINRGIPYDVFRHECEMKHWPKAKIDAEWNRMVLSMAFKKVKYNDVLHVCRYMGIDMVERSSAGVRSSLASKAAVKSSADLERAKDKTREVMKVAKAQAAASSMQVTSAGFDDAPLAVPDHLIQGLLDDDDVMPKACDYLDKEFGELFYQEEKRSQLLEQLHQEDLVEASIFAAQTVTQEEAESEADIAKFRIQKSSEFVKSKESWALLCQTLKKDVAEVLTVAKDKVAVDRDDAKEARATLATVDAKLGESEAEWEQKVSGFKAEFDKAASTAAMKMALNSMKDAKAEHAKGHQAIRRALSLLKALVKRRETAELKGMKGSSNEDASPEAGEVGRQLLVQHFVNKVLITDRTINAVAYTKGAPFDRSKVSFVCHSDLGSLDKSVGFLEMLGTWLSNQIGSKDTISVALEKAKHVEAIRKVLCERVFDDGAFERPHSVLHTWLSSVFALTLQRATAKWTSTGLFPYALGYWFLPLRSAMLFVGLPIDEAPGGSFKEKVDAISAMGPDDMERRVKASGFACKLEVGAALWMPPGFLVMGISLGEVMLLKWPCMAAAPGSDLDELRRVLSCTTSMISSFPSLAVQYKEWSTYLELHCQPSDVS